MAICVNLRQLSFFIKDGCKKRWNFLTLDSILITPIFSRSHPRYFKYSQENIFNKSSNSRFVHSLGTSREFELLLNKYSLENMYTMCTASHYSTVGNV